MPNVLFDLVDDNQLPAPEYVKNNMVSLIFGGSPMYGTYTPQSDVDFIGVYVPPKEIIFPFHHGYMFGLGKQPTPLTPIHKAHMQSWVGEADATLYGIVQFFNGLLKCNPYIFETIFVDNSCIITDTTVAKMIRYNREVFVSHMAWDTYTGYTSSLKVKNRDKNKSQYHVVRLLTQLLQLINTGTMDLRQNRQLLMDIRKGLFSDNQFTDMVRGLHAELNDAKNRNPLPPPRPEKVQQLLTDCLEEFYSQ